MNPGTRLGPYEITGSLGAGGMGEVYRARDTRLGREVALKILPVAFTSDPERVARFTREAQVLAALNHPHIAQIYGLEEGGDTRALVMELVDGGTLADRLARGPIPLDEALAIAKQIAEALEAAHEKGIIHRDLKPSNIAFTKDGQAKVLDFGLAKLAAPEAAGAGATAALSMSPTITSPALVTGAGMLLGTAAYMSPEQARGRAVDTRADVWAFGCLLYEMLAGRPPFEGETVTDVIASVIHKEPAWDALPRETPPQVTRALRFSLAKAPARRFRDVGDLRLELEHEQPQTPGTPIDRVAHPRRVPIYVALAFIVGAALAGAVAWRARRVPASSAMPGRWTISLPPDAPIDLGGPWSSLAISRDGTAIAYVAATASGRQLFLRRADDLAPHVVGGTTGVWQAFFSPDGASIGFIAADRLKKVAVTGGQPVTIADAANFGSGVWADDGTIYLGGRAGLAKVSPDGRLTLLLKPQPNEGRLNDPDLLPDGSLLFTIQPNDVTSFDDARIAVLTRGGERRVVLEGGAFARYSPTGHIVYAHGGQIMMVPFDVGRVAVSGQPGPLVSGGSFDPASGSAYFALSRNGALAYVPGGPLVRELSLGWVDRRGTLTPIQAPPRFYAEPRISPDATQIAFTIRAANDDIWTFDIRRGAFARLTFPHGNSEVPIWSADGRRIVYALDRGGVRSLVWRAADGGGSEEPLTPAEYFQTTGSWSPDGKVLAYTEDRPDTGSDLYLLPMDGDRKPVPFMTTAVNERWPAFSPDGRWIAYQSDETGRWEVFVAPYPGPGRKWQISDGGGSEPAWRADGREIIYRSGDRIVSIAVGGASPLQWGHPAELLNLPPGTGSFAMAPDGQRLLVIYGMPTRTARELTMMLNWPAAVGSR